MTSGTGFLFVVDRCTGCRACELACATENDLGWERSWRQVVTVNEGRAPGLPTFHLSVACNHCDDAPCVRECPSLALARDPATGAVLVDEDACIGCGYCGWVCPWDAPRFDGPGGVMSKCTLCHPRLLRGESPACVEACPTGALGFGLLTGATAVPGFPDVPVGPRVRFDPGISGGSGPVSTLPPGPGLEGSAPLPVGHAGRRAGRPVDLRSEAPLWIFTTLVAFLVGWVVAAALSGTTGAEVPVPAGLLAVGLALAGGVSTLHLGRKSRAWRAVLNVRRSRLSREVVLFGAFAVLALGSAIPSGGGAPVPTWVAAAVGVATLFAVDRVYDPVRTPASAPVHGADTLLIGPTVAAVVLGSLPAFLLLAVVRAGLYLPAVRNARRAAPRRRPAASAWRGPGSVGRGPLQAALRLGVGFVLPAALLAAGVGGALGALAVGEALDRARFYGELRAPTLGTSGRTTAPRPVPATGGSA